MTSTASSSDRSHSKSPINTSTVPPTTTSDIKSTTTARKTSLSDLEKELQEFDIDLDKDDVSDAENGQSAGVFKKTTDEDEVKTFK